MAKKPKTPEERREQDYRRLRTRHGVCLQCGEHDPTCLILEADHIAGREHHDDTGVVCMNCHRKLTDKRLDHVPANAAYQGMQEVIARYLLGLADFLAGIVETLREFGRWLLDGDLAGEAVQ